MIFAGMRHGSERGALVVERLAIPPVPLPTRGEQEILDEFAGRVEALRSTPIERLDEAVVAHLEEMGQPDHTVVTRLHGAQLLIDLLQDLPERVQDVDRASMRERFVRTETVSFIFRDALCPALTDLAVHERRQKPFRDALIAQMQEFMTRSNWQARALAEPSCDPVLIHLAPPEQGFAP